MKRLVGIIVSLILISPVMADVHRVYITGVIDNTSYSLLIRDIKTEKLTSGDTLEVVINSGGGYINSGLGMYGVLSSLRGEGIRVITIANGGCASAATFVLQAGDVRLVSPYCVYLIHSGQNEELQKMYAHGWAWQWLHADEIAEIERALAYNNNIVACMYATRTGRSIELVMMDMSFNNYLRADQLIGLHYADGYSSWSKRR